MHKPGIILRSWGSVWVGGQHAHWKTHGSIPRALLRAEGPPGSSLTTASKPVRGAGGGSLFPRMREDPWDGCMVGTIQEPLGSDPDRLFHGLEW